MFCTKCGTSNLDDAKFCNACGQTLVTDSEAVSATTEIVYAGFWQRFAALFIDGLILGVATVGLAIAMGLSFAATGSSMANMLWIYLLSFIMSAAYFTLMESSESGSTYGKRWLKLRVTDTQGLRLTRSRAFARWLAHALTNFTFYIGYLIQPFTEKKQALHDLVSSTVVVDTDSKNKSAGLIIALVVGVFVFIAIVGILAAIAIPAYSDYTTKAKVAQSSSIGELAKHAVETYYLANGRTPATLEAAGLTQLQLPSSLSEVLYNADTGEIQLVFKADQPMPIANKHLIYTPSLSADGSLRWKCASDDIQVRYLANSCR